MGIENTKREVDVRQVRCDAVLLDEAGKVTHICEAVTTEFLTGVDDSQGGPVLMNIKWLQLRTGGIKQWYFCSAAHLALWLDDAGKKVLDTGVQPLGTLKTRSVT